MSASSDTVDRVEAMNAILAQNWWAVALRGAAGILFGLIALLAPFATLLGLVILFAAYMLVDSIFAVVAAVRAARRHERWMLLVLEAVTGFLAAAIAVLWPGLTVVGFVLLIAVWSLVSGAFALAAAFQVGKDHGRWWLALGALASIVFGVLLIVAPLTGAVVLTWWVGAYALVFGAALLAMALRLRSHRNDHPHPSLAATA